MESADQDLEEIWLGSPEASARSEQHEAPPVSQGPTASSPIGFALVTRSFLTCGVWPSPRALDNLGEIDVYRIKASNTYIYADTCRFEIRGRSSVNAMNDTHHVIANRRLKWSTSSPMRVAAKVAASGRFWRVAASGRFFKFHT